MATVTQAQAIEYFAGVLHAGSWHTAGSATRQKALAQAERQLEAYRSRVDSTRFVYAVCEQVLWLIKGDSRADLQQAGVQGFTVNSMSEQFNTKGRPPTIAPQAWHYLVGVGVKVGTIR